MIAIPRAELDALKAQLRRQVGRGVAMNRIKADPGPGPSDDAPTFTREELAAVWGTSE